MAQLFDAARAEAAVRDLFIAVGEDLKWAGAYDEPDRRGLDGVLKPRGVLVVIVSEHVGLAMRGIRKPGATTVTSSIRGLFRDSTLTRSEAMSPVLGR